MPRRQGLGRELSVPMQLANMAFAEMTEALNRWRTATAADHLCYSSSNGVVSRSKLLLGASKRCSHRVMVPQSAGNAKVGNSLGLMPTVPRAPLRHWHGRDDIARRLCRQKHPDPERVLGIGEAGLEGVGTLR